MSTTTHRWTRTATFLAAAGAALAVMLGSAIPAAADTPVVPDAVGATGGTANIVGANANGQVVTIPTGAQWGDAVRDQYPTGSPAQNWQITLVRYEPVPYTEMTQWGSGPSYTSNMPVYRITNQQNGTCLDGFSDHPGVGSAVDFYGCDPHSQDQPNQLWMIAGSSVLWPDEGGHSSTNSTIVTGSDLFDGADGNAVAIYSYSSFLDNGNDLSKTLVVRGADSINGINSALSLQPQMDWPSTNKLWFLKGVPSPAPAPTTAPKKPTPSCTKFDCLIRDIYY